MVCLGNEPGRRRQNHGTLAATYGGHNLVRQADVNALILWPESLEPLTINFKLSYLTLLHLAEFFASRSNNILWENVNFSRIWTQIFGLEGNHDDHLITTTAQPVLFIFGLFEHEIRLLSFSPPNSKKCAEEQEYFRFIHSRHLFVYFLPFRATIQFYSK